MKKTIKTEKFDVTGMTCSSCVAHVEKSVRKVPGVQDVNVNLLTNSMSVDFEGDVTSDTIIHSVQNAGYEAFLKSDTVKSDTAKVDYALHEQESLKKRVIGSFVFLIPLLYLAMGPMIGLALPKFLSGAENGLYFASLQFILALPIYILNRKFFTNGFRSLWIRLWQSDRPPRLSMGFLLSSKFTLEYIVVKCQ